MWFDQQALIYVSELLLCCNDTIMQILKPLPGRLKSESHEPEAKLTVHSTQ